MSARSIVCYARKGSCITAGARVRGFVIPGPPERVATGPNQVWCWDITWLHSAVKGIFFYAYVIIDIWDRSIVQWSIHEREDDVLAEELFQIALRNNGYPNVWIHSDNGNPMKGVSLLGLFYELGLSNSYSRPRVSDDNPFIESWFKTLKYSISYPKNFTELSEARAWFGCFVDQYNTRLTHSGLHYITPQQVRDGEYQSIVRQRNETMQKAMARNPLRWCRSVKQLPEQHVVILNPSAQTKLSAKSGKRRPAA